MDIGGLVAGLKRFDELLESAELEPDPTRTDWRTMRPRVEGVLEGFRSQMLEPFRGLLPNIPEREVASAASTRVASQAAAVAALLGASGDVGGAAKLCAEAAGLCRPSETSTFLYVAVDEPEAFLSLQHARWLRRRADPRADKTAKAAKAKAKSPLLKKAAVQVLHGPKPIQSAPPLFRLNGCGASVYGAWDKDEEGFYTTVYCLCLLWIPVLPISAYRVRDGGAGRYQFLYRERLGWMGRLWQGLLGLALLGGGAAYAHSEYTSSETYLAQAALSEARAAEARGERDDALTRYRAVTASYVDSAEARDAASSLVRLSLEGLPKPCNVLAVEPARRLVAGILDVPPAARQGEANDTLETQLMACADEVDASNLSGRRAQLALLDLSADVRGTDANPTLAKKRAGAEHAIAQLLSTSRPVDALAHELRGFAEPEARVGAEQLVATISAVPSLALDAEELLERFAELACVGRDQASVCDTWKASVEDARSVVQALEPVVEAADEKALFALAKAHPQSHEVAVAFSALERVRGNNKAAMDRLLALGAPGSLTAEAQRALASAYSDQGDLTQADGILTALVDERLPAFQAAQRAYFPAVAKKQNQLVAEAKAGLHSDLESRVAGKKDSEIQEIFGLWLSEETQKDPALTKLRTTYLQTGSVISAVLNLGMIKVRRAADLTGDERTAVLREAEALFLAIRGEAEGDPTFHMGLGQVYHRLGRTEDGEKELQAVLAKKTPFVSMQVAMTYRELGLDGRARTVLEDAYASAATDQERFGVALSRANVAQDLEDQQSWADRSDPSSEMGRVARLSVRAAIALRDGKRPEAAKLYGEEATFYERNAKQSAAAANNAAIAYAGRYFATGDIADLRRSVTFLESAVKLEPDNAILLGHLADVQQQIGLIGVLDRFVHNKVLGLSGAEAMEVVSDLKRSALKDDVKKAVASSPAIRRALALSRDEQVLAPGKQEAYERAMAIGDLMGDEASLREVVKRVDAAPAFDAREVAERRRRWERAQDDEKYRRNTGEVIASCQRRLADAKADGHKPTLGVVLRLCADGSALARDLGVSFPEGEEPALLEQAMSTYPELTLDTSLAVALLTRGAKAAASGSSPLADALKADERVYGKLLAIHRAVSGPSGPEIVKSLLLQPDVVRAVALVSAREASGGAHEPGWIEYVLAETSGDPEKVAAVRGAIDVNRWLERARLGQKMYPGEAREAATVALVDGLRMAP